MGSALGDFCFGTTSVGQVRDHNEDAFFISLDGRLMVVADGLGGHAAGEVASALAIEAVRATFLDDAGEVRNVADIAKALQLAVAQADARIRAHVSANPACKGMATTLLIGVVRDAGLALAHVGDVRAYCCDADGLARLTEDHSVVAQLMRDGLMTEAEAATHELRNQIYQAVGDGDPPCPDIACHRFSTGDLVLLCTDGLWGEVSDNEIAEILRRPEPISNLATLLVARANALGGRDNITAIVYRQTRGEPQPKSFLSRTWAVVSGRRKRLGQPSPPPTGKVL